MNNPATLTVELTGDVLDALEQYVRTCEAFQRTPDDVAGAEFQAALLACKGAGERVANWLEIVLSRQAVPGTLGEALAEAERNREARTLARETDAE
ncbi:hypothetical protein [Pseudomonas sp. PNPG3]|uniref:hypothetical protein n=1 Tax=Pseudomonas sp. PNPG3 TaxID=2919497 RepID=UPI001FFD79CF|nr:hypothetical protein [Pseudomonas sp. PNPG3]MCK2122053.1 hypothetical protein [Pseudomonas sp. PNPG3]